MLGSEAACLIQHQLTKESPAALQRMTPTRFAVVLAHSAAAAEYVAPVLLMKLGTRVYTRRRRPTWSLKDEVLVKAGHFPLTFHAHVLRIPNDTAIWTGFFLLVAMHIYILLMPAPFDVYSWNLCFCLSGGVVEGIHVIYKHIFLYMHISLDIQVYLPRLWLHTVGPRNLFNPCQIKAFISSTWAISASTSHLYQR